MQICDVREGGEAGGKHGVGVTIAWEVACDGAQRGRVGSERGGGPSGGKRGEIRNACAACPGHTVRGWAKAGRFTAIDGGGEGAGERWGWPWGGPVSQRERQENVSGAHTVFIYTHRG